MASRRLLFCLLAAVAAVAAIPAVATERAPWKPKTDPLTYSPKGKDWTGVVSACKAVGVMEKRLLNFFTRAAFHDSMAVDVRNCVRGNTAQCGGADSSLVLTAAELARPENAYDGFAAMAGRAAIKIASFYDVSVADVMAVCGAIAIESLSKGRVKILGPRYTKNFRVGRLDSLTPNPPNQLPAANAPAASFTAFWKRHGFTMAEAMALMGSHSLVDEQECLMGPSHTDYCDPTTSDCSDVRMFRWEAHYFRDACSYTTKVKPKPPMEFDDPTVPEMGEDEFEALKKRETCKFTSDKFRQAMLHELHRVRAGLAPGDVDTPENVSITWSNQDCEKSAAWGGTSCPHSQRWLYTTNDAHLAVLCQGPRPADPDQAAVRAAMRAFTKQSAWDAVVPGAYIKMVTKYARWPLLDTFLPTYINGRECDENRWRLDMTCAAQSRLSAPTIWHRWFYCSTCTVGGISLSCHACCKCSTEFMPDADYVLKSDATGVVVPPTAPEPAPTPDNPATPIPVPEAGEEIEEPPPKAANPSPGQSLGPVPSSPYDVPGDACSGTGSVDVRGFPGSPFLPKVFQNAFRNPPTAVKAATACRTMTGGPCADPSKPGRTEHAIDLYNIDIVETSVNVNAGCTGLTKVLAYNGTVPGPTIYATVGRQTLVRFNNRIPTTSSRFPQFPPCHTAARKGRPIAVHLHGSASLAPYDGWAEDSTCSGESKEYLYPNNRPTTGWYHDHQLEITAENAHAGLAGFYLIKNSSDVGTGPDRWGLDGMQESVFMLADKVFDSACQLRFEPEDVHRNSHFGDVNVVNGVPFPHMAADPKWHRFRLLNAAVSRPWLLSIVDATGADVSAKACWVLGADGGYRREPAPFPSYPGLFIGVAERYDVACDLSAYKDQTLFVWNAQDERRMKDVPFFCYSHLVARIDVAATCTSQCTPALVRPSSSVPTVLDVVLTNDEYTAAVERAKTMQNCFTNHQSQSGQCDRTFVFGRRGGQWVINGETWVTARVAASNVGLNSHEIWCLETKGGWFHPIHIHLVDFYVIHRASHGKYQVLEPFETEVPKDVVALHPGSQVALLTRWGPHRGEYMFHCHNLRHEDNEMMRSLRVGSDIKLAAKSPSPAFVNISEMAFMSGSMGKTLYDQYKDPRLPAASAVPTASIPALNAVRAQQYLEMELYRIFYPRLKERAQLCDSSLSNPWYVRGC